MSTVCSDGSETILSTTTPSKTHHYHHHKSPLNSTATFPPPPISQHNYHHHNKINAISTIPLATTTYPHIATTKSPNPHHHRSRSPHHHHPITTNNREQDHMKPDWKSRKWIGKNDTEGMKKVVWRRSLAAPPLHEKGPHKQHLGNEETPPPNLQPRPQSAPN